VSSFVFIETLGVIVRTPIVLVGTLGVIVGTLIVILGTLGVIVRTLVVIVGTLVVIVRTPIVFVGSLAVMHELSPSLQRPNPPPPDWVLQFDREDLTSVYDIEARFRFTPTITSDPPLVEWHVCNDYTIHLHAAPRIPRRVFRRRRTYRDRHRVISKGDVRI